MAKRKRTSDPPEGTPPPAPDFTDDLEVHLAARRQLEDVERALALIEGRDPEELRRLRQQRELAAERFRQVAQAAAEARARAEERLRRRRKKVVVRTSIAVSVVVVVVAVVWAAARRRSRWEAVDGGLDRLTGALPALGFEVQRPALATENRIETTVEGESCFVALGAVESRPAAIRVQHGSEALSGTGSVGWCACQTENITVTAEREGSQTVGVRLLRVDPRAIGGAEALPLLEPRPDVVDATPSVCSIDHLDAWLDARKLAASPGGAQWLAAPARAGLVRAGFRGVASAPPSRPFAIVDALEQSCFLAASSVEGDKLGLRIDKGVRPISGAHGAIGWCDAPGARALVVREGRGEVVVVAAPSARIGGTLGLRELARRAGLGEISLFVPSEARGRVAREALLVAGVPDVAVAVPDGAHVDAPRIVALSLAEGGAFAPDGRANAAYGCSPSLGGGPRDLVCVQAWPQGWRQTGVAGAGGLAEARLPYWLSFFASVDDPSGLAAELSMLALARRLGAERFEPSTLDGVTETDAGVDVVGRFGDEAVVVLGMTAKPPWAFAYADGAPEPPSLDAEPVVIPIKPGERMSLTSTVARTIRKDARRTVVFRRPAPKP